MQLNRRQLRGEKPFSAAAEDQSLVVCQKHDFLESGILGGKNWSALVFGKVSGIAGDLSSQGPIACP